MTVVKNRPVRLVSNVITIMEFGRVVECILNKACYKADLQTICFGVARWSCGLIRWHFAMLGAVAESARVGTPFCHEYLLVQLFGAYLKDNEL